MKGFKLVSENDFMAAYSYKGCQIVFRKTTDFKPWSVYNREGVIIAMYNNEHDCINWINFVYGC
ncbi:hypothetical protein 2017DRC82_0090 [Vibrio phage ICP1]|nr:hypothetical protein 1992IndM4_0095 [Vibrio phage ICP1]QVV97420.1 hypothetical protein 2017DRC106_0090 [Vibrio phage ICP1]QVV97647.1 hypothetical protein 2017DRC32_0090 [Vibrio phage ICP1]QVV97874.1 hypothetical protein 2017DRC48_0090 [Vibrio phage ICP1]QVV98101.1 hypothetical protein 2017DRC55_0090 [Vibrio phage ICP1]